MAKSRVPCTVSMNSSMASPDGGLIGCMGKMGSTIIAHPRFTAGLDHTTPFIDLSQGVNVTPRCIVSSPNWI